MMCMLLHCSVPSTTKHSPSPSNFWENPVIAMFFVANSSFLILNRSSKRCRDFLFSQHVRHLLLQTSPNPGQIQEHHRSTKVQPALVLDPSLMSILLQQREFLLYGKDCSNTDGPQVCARYQEGVVAQRH